MIEIASSPTLVVQRASPGVLRVLLSGNWRAPGGLPGVEIIRKSLGEPITASSLEFDVTDLHGWDSRLVGLIHKCAALCRERHVEFRGDALPEGVRRLLRLADSICIKKQCESWQK